jgi:adenylosuccinate lyase
MKLSSLTALNPLDGRYSDQLTEVAPQFSELNLILIRLALEIEWLKTLAYEPKIKEIKPFTRENLRFLLNLVKNFDKKDIVRIKELEKQTNHDVKAIEYFLKEKLATNKKLKAYREFVHFGCTSDDINNLSYAIILTKTLEEILIPRMSEIILQLKNMAHNYAETPMLARTHGQAATPTTLGKEAANFAYRLSRQFNYLLATPILGKFNGAVGNFNAQVVAYPEVNWQKICQKFVEALKIDWNPYTTQIEPHDWLVEYCDILVRFNTILIGFCRDIWNYVSIGYFKQKIKSGEVGSSTMPHKINPIDFENAEGNLGLANALFQHFSNKLPISRWQRDLTDSTVMRNLGVAIGYSVLAYKSLQKGLNKLEVNHATISKDLNDHWEVLTEAVQTTMRRYNIEAPYEKMKILTRGQKLEPKTLQNFINNLNIPKEAKKRLLKLTPQNYLGRAVDLAKTISLLDNIEHRSREHNTRSFLIRRNNI